MCHEHGVSPASRIIEQYNADFALDIPHHEFFGQDSLYYIHFFESDWAAVIERATDREVWYDRVSDNTWALSDLTKRFTTNQEIENV